MLFLYHLFIHSYYLAVLLASFRNKKAKQWIEGRKTALSKLEFPLNSEKKTIWMHCSSAGEYEQGMPLLNELSKRYPNYQQVVTFFSPSGYNAAQKAKRSHIITYLPLDTKKNAQNFLDRLKPDLIIFIKYEFWYHHLKSVAERKIPLLLVSGVFRENQVFFKRWGGFFRQMLSFFDQLFVQDLPSARLVRQLGFENSVVAGDTRFDRVIEISNNEEALPWADWFAGAHPVIVAGSTWEQDEKILAAFLLKHPGVKLILAPHEINPTHIQSIRNLFGEALFYSDLIGVERKGAISEEAIREKFSKAQVLVVDAYGFLSRLYKTSTLSFVGGGFTRDGIHNILEAAVWGKPVIIGPNYKKYREAAEMIEAGGAFSVANETELEACINKLLVQPDFLSKAGKAAETYIQDNAGATQKIMEYIQEKRLLTRL